ncbi:hypothetical protein [Streptomyces sp. NPDC008092]|uniref:hypothetical protein n=1 Tax=Streptomyces sp. NPDC008092 TaxID=3364808 RepID=UPI0036EFBCD0
MAACPEAPPSTGITVVSVEQAMAASVATRVIKTERPDDSDDGRAVPEELLAGSGSGAVAKPPDEIGIVGATCAWMPYPPSARTAGASWPSWGTARPTPGT